MGKLRGAGAGQLEQIPDAAMENAEPATAAATEGMPIKSH
jgi:hypothetical protein